MQFAAIITLAFTALAIANPIDQLGAVVEPRCVGNLGVCDPTASDCCSGLYCCGIIGDKRVCQTGTC
ncbi:uncharacterized protein BCR38DRAFT_487876 [Pseudomassariella vexata]|uniref:Uncharacterized protein n=1 Tax=Pseudomassariella vexata TaxID=1141098 RepID=A0A1Y2DNN4_9PEZI|nr:uncharacterized protein BCR38DRAFT_487876 [Pseudomassariella vexata]ORY60817.1 hypothetical protein BCR38DRAFT_487876 [Pseudomassariella vexata]